MQRKDRQLKLTGHRFGPGSLRFRSVDHKHSLSRKSRDRKTRRKQGGRPLAASRDYICFSAGRETLLPADRGSGESFQRGNNFFEITFGLEDTVESLLVILIRMDPGALLVTSFVAPSRRRTPSTKIAESVFLRLPSDL